MIIGEVFLFVSGVWGKGGGWVEELNVGWEDGIAYVIRIVCPKLKFDGENFKFSRTLYSSLGQSFFSICMMNF